MQVCHLSEADAERIQHPGFVPDCHFHDHLSKRDANQAAADGRVRFISRRAVVAVGAAPISGYWYDVAVKKNDRNLGTAQSGAVRTVQLVNFLPRGMRRGVRNIKARGARRRRFVNRENRQQHISIKKTVPEVTMTNLFERRKKSGMSQFLCAQRSGISRMRLSLAKTGQITLSPEEEAALRQVLDEYISAKAHEIALLSQEQHSVAG